MGEHLDFNTDFLEKSKAKSESGMRSGSVPAIFKTSSKWKPWLIGGGIVLGVIVIVAASASSPTSSTGATPNTTYTPSTPTSGSSDQVRVGQYMCSSYNSGRADNMAPSTSKESLQAESDALDTRIAALQSWHSRIENMYVDESDQDSIDTYNAQVDSYNASKNRLNSDIDAYEAKVPRFNAQVDAYNNFLQSNCTPA